MATLPGGSCWSFWCCAAVLGVITLKPAATSMLSLFCVLLVVAQPTVNANRAMTLIMLNETGICFMFLGWFQVCGCLGDDLLGTGILPCAPLLFRRSVLYEADEGHENSSAGAATGD